MSTVVKAIIAVIVVAVVAGGAFFAGTAYGQAQAQNTRAEFFRNRQGGGNGGAFGQNGANGQNGGMGQNGASGRPAAFGTVKSVNGDTIVLTQQDGSTVTVTVNNQTTIQKQTTGSLSDIQPGARITVTSDQTGSQIVARGIQVRPGATP